MAKYLARAAKPSANPWGWAFVTVAAPLVTWLLATKLLTAINIEGPQATRYSGVTHKTLRTAILQVLTVDLGAERIQNLLMAADLPPVDANEASRRKIERTERIKPAAARLAGDLGTVTDALVQLAMAPDHPGKDPKVIAGASVQDVVDGRLKDADVRLTITNWINASLDVFSADEAKRAVPSGKAIDDIIASAVAPARLRAKVRVAITPTLESSDSLTGAPTWSADIVGRLLWAIATLVFCLALIVVVIYAFVQIFTLKGQARWAIVAVAAIATAVGVYFVASSGLFVQTPPPLAAALKSYAGLYRVGMLEWASMMNMLTVGGAAALVAGSVSTMTVEVKAVDDLDEQLVGLKSLFNAGTVLLLAGVVEIYALLRWPMAFIADDVGRAAMQSAAATYSAAVGAMFSIMLLVVYIPATIAMRRQALANGIPGPAVRAALARAGFGDLTSQQLTRMLQALLPLLPGAINLVL